MSMLTILYFAAQVNADVGLVVEFGDGSFFTQCLYAGDGISGYDLLESSGLDLLWTPQSAFGRMICKINGEGTEVSGQWCEYSGKYWTFSINDGAGWAHAPVGLGPVSGCWNREMGSWDGHYCSLNQDVIGFVFGSGTDTPAEFSFPEICRMLRILQVDSHVDGRSDSRLSDGDRIRKKARPGSKVEFNILVENSYSLSGERIRDVEVSGYIRDIDNGDDLDDYAGLFDLRAGREKKVSLNFELPLEIEEGTYAVDIELVGRDASGFDWTDSITLDLEVKKEKNALLIRSFELEPAYLACARTGLELYITVINLGANDANDVVVRITSPELDLDFRKDGIALTNDLLDSGSIYRESVFFDIPDGLLAGTYNIDVRAYYDVFELSDAKSVQLSVVDCNQGVSQSGQTNVPEPENKKSRDAQVEFGGSEAQTQAATEPGASGAAFKSDVLSAKSEYASPTGADPPHKINPAVVFPRAEKSFLRQHYVVWVLFVYALILGVSVWVLIHFRR